MEFSLANLDQSVSVLVETATSYVVEYTFSVVGAILILIAGFVIAGFVKRGVRRAVMGLRNGDATLASFLSTAARYAVLVLVIVMVLSQFGVQTASIIAALGAAGLAIGLALQGTLQNVASGLMLLFLRPFRVGDYIDCQGTAGVVQDIGLFATEFKTPDGLYMLVPNSEVWGRPVTNYNRHDQRRFDLVVGVAYDTDVEMALAEMKAVVSKEARILGEPAPTYFVSNLGDSAVDLTATVWIATSEWWVTSRDLTQSMKTAFDRKGISIPFPQRDIRIISENSEVA